MSLRLGLPSWRGPCLLLVGEWWVWGSSDRAFALLAAANRRSSPCHERPFAVKARGEQSFHEQMFDSPSEHQYPAGMPDVQPAASAATSPPAAPATTNLTSRQREILEVIDRYMRERGYPPSVREIGEAVGPHLALHRAQPPGVAAAAGAPAARSHQAARHRGPLGPVVRRRARAAARRATCRSSATSPPAPTCSRRRTSRSCCPLPADFTGDGDLFMLRVRGRLDDRGRHPRRRLRRAPGTQPTADNGDIVVAGIPGEEATVKTYRAKGAKVDAASRPTPGWSPWCSTRRRHGLRQGGHGAAATLTAAAPAPPTCLLGREVELRRGAPVRRRSASAA